MTPAGLNVQHTTPAVRAPPDDKRYNEASLDSPGHDLKLPRSTRGLEHPRQKQGATSSELWCDWFLPLRNEGSGKEEGGT